MDCLITDCTGAVIWGILFGAVVMGVVAAAITEHKNKQIARHIRVINELASRLAP